MPQILSPISANSGSGTFHIDDDSQDHLLAERAVQLGGVAGGTLAEVARQTKLQNYTTDLAAGRDHLAALIDSMATFARSVRQAAGDSGGAGDSDTEDLFTEVSRGADKMLWFLEAHLQADS